MLFDPVGEPNGINAPEEDLQQQEGAEEQKKKGGQSKGKLYVVLHTIKYAFAKWYSILPFERFMHCLGSSAEEEEEEAGWLVLVEEMLSNGAKQGC